MDLDFLARVMRASAGPNKLRPCLYGPTGAGKTARVEAAAEALGMPTAHLLLQQALPEDIAGLPRVENGRTVYALPDWAHAAVERPHVLFLDEVDKPREEVRAAILTLLWDLRLRHVTLHPKTIIVCAGQPVDPAEFLATETGRAFSARLLWLPVSYDWGFIGDKVGIDLSDFPIPECAQPPVLPEPTPRTVTATVELLRSADWNAEERRLLAYGAIPKAFAEVLLARLSEHKVAARDLAALWRENDIESLERLAVSEIVGCAGDIAVHGSPDLFGRSLYRVMVEGSPDDAQATFAGVYARLKNDAAADPNGEATLCGDATFDEVADMIERTAKGVYEVYATRGKSEHAH